MYIIVKKYIDIHVDIIQKKFKMYVQEVFYMLIISLLCFIYNININYLLIYQYINCESYAREVQL